MALQRSLACAVVLTATLAGCGSAHLVRRDAAGGTIALDGRRDGAMKEARDLMVEHCRGPYRIVEEGAGGQTDGERSWQLRYVCGTTAPVAPPDAAVESTTGGSQAP